MESAAFILARKYDEEDVLQSYLKEFLIGEDVIYLDGNSLGRLPVSTTEKLDLAIKHQWGDRLIRSWNESWINLPLKVAANIAKIVGADPEEIIICDNTSVNLYKLAFAALTMQKERREIITDENNFPTDQYIFQHLIDSHFSQHRLTKIKGQEYGEASLLDIESQLSHNTALLSMSHVLYKSGYLYDMNTIGKLAQKYGVLTLWDLSHSVGAVPINLHESCVDMAVGCTYKYLNGGPGAPAFIYVKKELIAQLVNPIAGWFSHERPFDFSPNYEQSHFIQRFGTGTPSVLSIVPILSSTDITIRAGMEKLRSKSLALSSFFIKLVDEVLGQYNFQVCTPRNENDRGSHVSLFHEEAYRINLALINPQDGDNKKVIPDYRPPGYIRFGFAPLYNSFEEITLTIFRIKSIMDNKEYLSYDSKIEGVT
jgi:kynureninase